MTARKTPTSTNPEQAARDREAIDRAVALLMASGGDDFVVAPLADLSRPAMEHLRTIWPSMSDEVRLRSVRAMLAESEERVDRDYTRALTVAVDDADPDVRLLGWDGLWEDGSLELLHLLLDRVSDERDERVRAAMAEALGHFALRVELEELSENDSAAVRGALLGLVRRDPSGEVRRRALESAGFISGDPDIVDEIRAAVTIDDDSTLISALKAMGRQSDQRWRENIFQHMSNEEPEIRFEAVRAAGVSQDPAYLSAVIDLVDDEDSEVQLAAITALGSIGGNMAVRTLRRILQSDSIALVDAAQEALDEALLSTGELHTGPRFDPRDADAEA